MVLSIIPVFEVNKITTYIAFLRAVNVGGRFVKMDVLRKIFESMKFKNVRTFIQSGNVIFDSGEKASVLEPKIEKMLKSKLEFEVKTMIRSMDEVISILKSTPFKEDGKIIKVYVSFLSQIPKEKIVPGQVGVVSHLLMGKDLYTLFDKSKKEKNPFSNSMIEKKLKMSATTRDIGSLRKLMEFCK